MIWTDSSAFLSCHVREANCHAKRADQYTPIYGVLVWMVFYTLGRERLANLIST